MLDTTYLIALVNDRDTHHDVARRYYKYFLSHDITMCLSTIVIAEFHQKQSVIDLLASQNFRVIPFNIENSLATADLAHALGNEARTGGKAEHKDDVKILAQAKSEEMEFLITADASTLHKYCQKLKSTSMLKTQSILLADGYEESWFNQGQKSLSL